MALAYIELGIINKIEYSYPESDSTIMFSGSMSDAQTPTVTSNVIFAEGDLVTCDFTYLPIVDDELPQVPHFYTHVDLKAMAVPKLKPRSHCQRIPECICKPLGSNESLLSPSQDSNHGQNTSPKSVTSYAVAKS